MQKQISIIAQLSILLGLSIFAIVPLFFFLVKDLESQRLEKKRAKESEPAWYCGTMDLPENQVLSLDHPGRLLFDGNCIVCHSLIKSTTIVGPSMYGVTEKLEPEIFNLLLSNDPDSILIRTVHYQELKKESQIGFHEDEKFQFTETDLRNLKSYIDTITVIQN